MDRITFLETDNEMLEWAVNAWAERCEDMLDRLEKLCEEHPDLYHLIRETIPELRFRDPVDERHLTVVE